MALQALFHELPPHISAVRDDTEVPAAGVRAG
jgi:hypothetical protein